MSSSSISLIVMIIGSVILVSSFIFQTIKMVSRRTTTGLHIFAWSQNFIGRTLFVIYGAFVPSNIGIPVALSQGLICVLSVPVLYYIFRNHKTHGVYVKDNYRQGLMIIAIATAIIELVLICLSLLIRREINVIHLVLTPTPIIVLSILCSIIASTAFIPQTIRIVRSGKATHLSFWLTVCFVIGNLVITSSFIVTGITTGKMPKYLSPIILTSISALAMMVNLGVKVINLRQKPQLPVTVEAGILE